MKKLLGIVVLGLLWLVPVNANACTLNDFFSSNKFKCDSKEELIEISNELDKISKRSHKDPFAKYLLPKNMTVRQAQKLIKKEIKIIEDEILYRCHLIAGNAKNSWSAKKIYQSCVKGKLN